MESAPSVEAPPTSVTLTSPELPDGVVLWANRPTALSPWVAMKVWASTRTFPEAPWPLRLWAKMPSESSDRV